jgi:putative ABC transport system substrate-binding protein
MRRREFIGLIGGTVASLLGARAQQPLLPVIGYLESASQGQFSNLIPAFRKGLSETGYTDGQNVRIEYRWAEGQYDRLPTLTTELIRGDAALIFTTAFISAHAASTFAFIVNPSNTRADSDIQEMEAAARALGQQIVVAKAATNRNFETAFETLAGRSIQAVVIGGDPFFNSQAQQVVTLASHYAIPTIYPLNEFTTVGGLMSYGSSIADAYRQAGIYAGRILKGAKPADLPVMQPTKFELVINLKTAKALGLTVPPTLLARADEVIE